MISTACLSEHSRLEPGDWSKVPVYERRITSALTDAGHLDWLSRLTSAVSAVRGHGRGQGRRAHYQTERNKFSHHTYPLASVTVALDIAFDRLQNLIPYLSRPLYPLRSPLYSPIPAPR